MSEGLDKLAGAIGDTLKTAPTLYEDALQPTVQEIGKFTARIPRAINAAFSGLDKWILNKEYAIDETKKLLALKLENVAPEKIVTPEAYVAIPTIQAISYSMNSEELRNLYANLLAKAMTSDTKQFVHPSYVEIIKQMSPYDAHVLKEIATNQPFQILDFYYCKYQDSQNSSDFLLGLEEPIEKRGFEGLTFISDISPDMVNISFDNILRLGLIQERFTIGDAVVDERIKLSPIYKRMIHQLQIFETDSSWKYEESVQHFYLTNLGRSFCSICLED